MADFRKMFFAFAAVALLAGLTVPASAQSICAASPGVNTLVRAEGYTELVGDIVLNCSGGIPTAQNVIVPQVDILVTLNSTITSRILATLNNNAVAMTEALLIMDEPNTTKWNNLTPHPITNCGLTGQDSSSSGPGVCSIVSDGSPNDTYDGNITNIGTALCSAQPNGASTYGCGRPNVFQGRQAAVLAGSVANTVQFLGIPYDAPGAGLIRTIRMTNIRVDATRYGVASPFSTVPVIATISISNSTSIALSSTSVQVGQVEQGLSSKNTASSFLQCEDTLTQGGGTKAFPLFGGNTTPSGGAKIRVQENFPNAFKVRNVAEIVTNGTLAGTNYTFAGTLNYGLWNQNVPGALYGTETGFYFPPNGNAGTGNPPSGFGSPVNGAPGNALANGGTFTGISQAGFVESGTRIAIITDPAPAGSTLYFPLTVSLKNLATGQVTGVLRLVSTDANGANLAGFGTVFAPNSTSPLSSSNNLGYAPATNGNLGVYEDIFSDPNSTEYADIQPLLFYTSNVATGTPTPGTVNAAASFAPFYSATSTPTPGLPQGFPQNGGLPIPRFASVTTPTLLYSIVQCRCDLLFPWVVGGNGYNTSIVVDNTSADPFGTIGATGTVTFNYYGTKGVGFDPTNVGTFAAQTTTVAVPPGSYAVDVVTSSGGGGTAGLTSLTGAFAGYVITQANFQFCHGVASISGNGIQPQTYVGLELDYGLTRNTLQVGESLGH